MSYINGSEVGRQIARAGSSEEVAAALSFFFLPQRHGHHIASLGAFFSLGISTCAVVLLWWDIYLVANKLARELQSLHFRNDFTNKNSSSRS